MGYSNKVTSLESGDRHSENKRPFQKVGLWWLMPLTGPDLTDQTDKFLHEAAEPINYFYDPEGDGTRLASQGVHEHWNNSTDKQYSRNLDPENGHGIELIRSIP